MHRLKSIACHQEQQWRQQWKQQWLTNEIFEKATKTVNTNLNEKKTTNANAGL